jgi:aminoglycoside phosphotransferase (APT) family kinase protein
MTLPQGPEQITSDWLSFALGRDAEVTDVEQIGVGVGLLGRLFRVTAGDESYIVKLPTLDEGVLMNVIAPMRFYEREVRFYEQVADDTPVPTPRLHHSHFDPEKQDFVLVIEDLGGCRMSDQTVGCDVSDARTAVGTLVDLHARWWADEWLASLAWLPRIADPPFPQVIAGMYKQALPGALELLSDRMSAVHLDFAERFVELVPWFVDEGARDPVTLVHGDFRLDNLFFGDDVPLRVVDWQIAFKGRAGYDLGYFLSQSLDTNVRRAHEEELVGAYHSGLAAKGIDYPEDELRADYARTVAFCFCYPIISAGQIDYSNERHRQLIEGMLDRAVAAIEDNDALALLPD